MVKRMLVDATHAEETRVVVVSGNRLEEFDFETASKKQLKGNIYLAKVTRVEPSLQAAFVEYGGNRHGFLAFSEIHPDYYRIPVADREALIAEETAAHKAADAGGREVRSERAPDGDSDDPFRDPRDDDPRDDDDDAPMGSEREPDGRDAEESAEAEGIHADAAEGRVETVGGDDMEEGRPSSSRSRPRRSYKIQEVIKRRQIMLVQVTKEERGNKGAALTTYLSLAGRYCVLMPNTPRGGGISRKIANPKDRKKMKAILDDLFIPEGMAVILRTAGMERTKAEIKRDLDYLLRLWDSIRELTLQSTAPTLIHEEANLIKRAERDLYNKDIEEILVAGEDGYRSAKDFMRMLMPSHAKKVQLYKDPAIPLFHRYQVETQIDAMHSPVVQLKSGGYIVLNSTEALVAIDVNSGRSTRERNIEETAYKTNLEAAEEVARQLRLRDLAGLIVIDFIDMEEDRHNQSVERKLKEAMRQDRARIQLGRISPFGLLELSRQRLRPSLVETHFETCPHCTGTGLIRSIGSAALSVLRAIEEEGIRKRSAEIRVHVPTDIALYLLNEKRDALREIEERYGFFVRIGRDDALISPQSRLEQIRARGDEEERAAVPVVDSARVFSEIDEEEEERADEEAEAAEARAAAATEDDEERGGQRRRSRRGRRRRGDRDEQRHAEPRAADGHEAAGHGDAPVERLADVSADEDEDEEDADRPSSAEAAGGDEGSRRKRRRGKRGGRRRSARLQEENAEQSAEASGEDGEVTAEEARPEEIVPEAIQAEALAEEAIAAPEQAADEPAEVEKPKRRRAPRKRKAEETEAVAAEAAPAEAATEAAQPAEKPKRKRAASPRTTRSRKKAEAVETAEAPMPEAIEVAAPELPAPVEAAPPVKRNGAHAEPEEAPASAPAEEENRTARASETVNQPPEKPKRGWWRRLTEG